MVMSGAALQSVAMCCLASTACFCPGPGSSVDILQIAAWALVNIVTWFGVGAISAAVFSARALTNFGGKGKNEIASIATVGIKGSVEMKIAN